MLSNWEIVYLQIVLLVVVFEFDNKHCTTESKYMLGNLSTGVNRKQCLTTNT